MGFVFGGLFSQSFCGSLDLLGIHGRWKRKQDVVLRQDHKAGEKLFVDWGGDPLPIYDPDTGSLGYAPIFVASLGASSYTYAEATRDQQLASWIGAHVRTFETMGGCARFIVPDNTKTAVTRACRYDPDLNPTYQAFAVHYGVGILPARPYKPRGQTRPGREFMNRALNHSCRRVQRSSCPTLGSGSITSSQVLQPG